MSDQAPMRTIIIDCAGAKAGSDIWQRYLDAAKPEGTDLFGRNLDAFWDAIEHGGPGWPGEAKLVFKHSTVLADLTVDSELSFLDGLRRIANEATQTQIELE